MFRIFKLYYLYFFPEIESLLEQTPTHLLAEDWRVLLRWLCDDTKV